MALDIVFWILAVITVGAALAVVLSSNIFRAALFLVLCFFAVAGIFITLGADFLAAVQVLIYVGAISVLIILVIMLTPEVWRGGQASRLRLPAFIVIFLLAGVMLFIILNSSWQVAALSVGQPTTTALGALLFGEGGFILPVIIAAALLLAAVVGAIALLREK